MDLSITMRSKGQLLDDHPIAAAAAKDLGRVHLFGFGRRYDEGAGRGGAGEIGIFIHAIPEQGGEGFGPVVSQVLMFVPGTPPPPAIADVDGSSWGILCDTASAGLMISRPAGNGSTRAT